MSTHTLKSSYANIFSLGNCNKDGSTDILDIVLLLNQIFLKDKSCVNSDINKDSKIDLVDLNILSDEIILSKKLKKEISINLNLKNQLSYTVISSIEIDKECFVQGLVYSQKDNEMYISCGLYHNSSLQRFSLKSPKNMEKLALKAYYFAEGITLLSNHLLQLTWKEGSLFYYFKAPFLSYSHQIDNFNHKMSRKEGWGLTNDVFEKYLITSDGSSSFYFFYSDTLDLANTLSLTGSLNDGSKIYHLNELEFIKDRIWANIWKKNIILIISPYDGNSYWLDLTALAKRYPLKALNGIAFDAKNDLVFVTGKKWGRIFSLKIRGI